MTRADVRGLYKPLLESEFIPGGTPWNYEGEDYGSPIGTLWRFGGPTFGDNSASAVDPTAFFSSWYTWAYAAVPGLLGMYSTEDDAYYDFYVTNWTSGNGQGWNGDGNGSGNGGGFSYYRSGPINPIPTIINIEDVPNDQGGRVYVKFSRSIHDTDSLRTAEMYTIERLDGDTWVGLNSVSASGNDEYVVEATTLADSTSENDAIMTYRIIAAMEEGNFASDPGSGYSVDNIAPGAPTGVVAAISDGVVYLEWAHSDANDLDYYAVYRSTDPEFLPGEESMIGSSEGSEFADDVEELGDYYYAVTALDLHENESDPSEFVNVTLLSLEDIRGLPEVFTLHQNYPNPFNPNTQIQYALPTDANVSVVIYDLMGRQIRTLVNQQVVLMFPT